MKKILKFIGKYKIFLVLSVLLATVSVIFQLYVPILFGDAIDQIVAEHQVQFDAMWILLREILVLVAISALATWIMNMINNHMTYHIVQDIVPRQSVIFSGCPCLIWTVTVPEIL